MKSLVELFPQPLEVNKEGQRRSCLIRESSADGQVTGTDLWFIYPANFPMLKDDNCDSYLLAILLLAMQENANIKVHGSVSKELLANLTELQYIWNRWSPESYSLVDITVNDIRENEVRQDGAIFAFSGGVDAQFTAYRHATGKAGYSTQQQRAAILVHGFDIPVDDIDGIAGAAKKAAKTLESIGVDLLVVKTNLKSLNMDWEHSHGLAVAAVLSGLSMYAGTGMLGSGEPYESLETPWGSHPMTDHLFSSGNFRMIHDGAGFNRSEKVKVLAEWDEGIKNLRVCWEGELKDINCGKCEKCIRTRLNILLAGIANPQCFSTPLDKSLFKPIVLKNGPAIIEWQLIRDEVKSTGKGSEWLPQIEAVLKRKPKITLGSLLLPPTSQRRAFVKKLLKKP